MNMISMGLMLLAASTGARELTNKTLSIVMNDKIPSYEVPVGLGTHFEVWTERPCEPPSLGDPNVFKRDFDQSIQNPTRFVLAVIKNIPDRRAHFTLKCEGGLGVILQARVVSDPADAIGIINVRVSDTLNAFTAQAVSDAIHAEQEKTKANNEEQRRKVLLEREQRNLKSLHARSITHHDIEHGRFGKVVVHVTQQITMGERTYVFYRIENNDPHAFAVDAIEMHAKSNAMPTSQSFYMPTGRVEPSGSEMGVLGFDTPLTDTELTLMVRSNTGITIEVDDVDLR